MIGATSVEAVGSLVHERALPEPELGDWLVGSAVGILVHEAIHGLAFGAFGVRPSFGFGLKFLLPYAYATSPGALSRNAYLAVGLAPLVFIDLLGMALVVIAPHWTWLGPLVAFNKGGAVGDLWMVGTLLRWPRQTLVEDRKEGFVVLAPPGMTVPERLPKVERGPQRAHPWLQAWLSATAVAFALLIFGGPALVGLIADSLSLGDFEVAIGSVEFVGFSRMVGGSCREGQLLDHPRRGRSGGPVGYVGCAAALVGATEAMRRALVARATPWSQEGRS